MKLKKIPVHDHDDMKGEMKGGMMPPYLGIESKQVPEVKDWEVGETYRLVVDLKQTSKSEDRDGRVSGGFELIAYKHIPEKSIDEMSDKEFEDYEGRMLEKNND